MSSNTLYALITLLGVALAAILALAGFVVQQWIKGELVPRTYYADAVARADSAEERETKWRDAYEHGAETIRLLSEPMGRIAQISGTTSQIIAAALPAAAHEASEGSAGVPVA